MIRAIRSQEHTNARSAPHVILNAHQRANLSVLDRSKSGAVRVVTVTPTQEGSLKGSHVQSATSLRLFKRPQGSSMRRRDGLLKELIRVRNVSRVINGVNGSLHLMNVSRVMKMYIKANSLVHPAPSVTVNTASRR